VAEDWVYIELVACLVQASQKGSGVRDYILHLNTFKLYENDFVKMMYMGSNGRYQSSLILPKADNKVPLTARPAIWALGDTEPNTFHRNRVCETICKTL